MSSVAEKKQSITRLGQKPNIKLLQMIKEMPTVIQSWVSQQLNLVTQMDSHMKAHQMMGMQGLCVKVMACLLGKHYLYMAMGMVNICTVKAREFKPSSFPLPVSFCSLCLSTQENRTIKTEKKEKNQGFSVLSLCVLLSFGNCSLSTCFLLQLAGEAHCTTVTPRRHLSSRVFGEHACLFSDNSLFSLNTFFGQLRQTSSQ